MSTTTANPALVTLEPVLGSSLVKKALMVIAGSWLIAAAQYAVGWPVPTTLQMVAVLFVGLTFGFRMATAAVALYLAQGYFGLPVFAGGKFGPAALFGLTGGFLFGFLVGASVLGFLADKGFTRSWAGALGGLLICSAIVFAMGFVWFAYLSGIGGSEWATGKMAEMGVNMWEFSWLIAVKPFLLVDAVKILLVLVTGKGLLSGVSELRK